MENEKKDQGCCGGQGSCCGEHKHEHEKTEGHECGSGGCGCGHDHDHDHADHDAITLELEDGSQLVCPIIDIFEAGENEYIALLHPVDENVLLYRFTDYEDGTVELDIVEDDAEYQLVSSTFLALQAEEVAAEEAEA